MRSTLIRTAAVAAAALATVSVSPSHAATAKFKATSITDAAGDGNGLNGQGLEDTPSQSTPSDYSGGDIVSIDWTTTGTAKKPTGFQVVMKLSGAPSPGTIYRVTTATADCTTFWLTYTVFADGPTSGSLQHNCPGFTATGTTAAVPLLSKTESDPLTTVAVNGSTITWTVPATALPKAIKKGTAITKLSGETRFMAGASARGGATVPTIDLAAGDGTYTSGQ